MHGVFPPQDQRLTLAFVLSVAAHLLLVFAGPSSMPFKTPDTQVDTLRVSISTIEQPLPEAAKIPLPQKDGAQSSAVAASNRPLALPGLAAPYIEASALDQRPRFAAPLPDELPFGLAGEATGAIRFVLYVSERGAIDRTETSAPAGLEYAARYVEQIIRASQIVPGSHKGMPARARWTLEFAFGPGTGSAVEDAPR